MKDSNYIVPQFSMTTSNQVNQNHASVGERFQMNSKDLEVINEQTMKHKRKVKEFCDIIE